MTDKMKTVTYAQFLTFDPYWLSCPEKAEQLKEIGSRQEKWTALDVLALDDVSEEDRLWSVLRPEFLPDKILHEFSCQCAERALSKIDNPDPRSVNAIAVKRKWMAGEATDAELDAAWAAACDATLAAARGSLRSGSWSAEYEASWDAVWAAARDAYTASWAAESREERQWQVNMLINLIQEKERHENRNL